MAVNHPSSNNEIVSSYPLPKLTTQEFMDARRDSLPFQLKCLQKQLKDYANYAKEILSFTIDDESRDLLHWEAKIQGPVDTPYENGVFRIDLVFPSEYPFKPPKIKFKTKVFHPNISSNGETCLDMLHSTWSAAFTIHTTLLSVVSLLSDPNTEDFIVPEFALLYKQDRNEFNIKAREWTRKYAMADSTSIEIQESPDKLDNDNDTKITMNVFSPLPDENEAKDVFRSQTSRTYRPERFNVFEPLQSKTFDNGESKEFLPIVAKCLVRRSYESQMKRDRKLDPHKTIPKMDLDRDISLFVTILQIEIFKHRYEEKYKKMLDVLLSPVVEREFELQNQEQTRKLVDILLDLMLRRKELQLWNEKRSERAFEIYALETSSRKRYQSERLTEQNYKMLTDELLSMIKEREKFELWKDEQYEMLRAGLRAMRLENLFQGGRVTREISNDTPLPDQLEINGNKFWKEEKYKTLIDGLSSVPLELGCSELWSEKNYQILFQKILTTIVPGARFEFRITVVFSTFVENLLRQILEIERLGYWKEKSEKLIDEFTQILEVKKIDQIWEEEKNRGLIGKLSELMGKAPEQIGQGCARIYTMNVALYSQLNQFLREADEAKIEIYGPFVRLLHFYFDHPSSIEIHSIKVYRAMNLLPLLIDDYKEATKHGGSYRWGGFSSASKCQEVAEFFSSNTLFIMHLKKVYQQEKKAIDISNYSQFPDEEEILLKAGIEFTVKNVKYDDEQKKHYIYLDVYV